MNLFRKILRTTSFLICISSQAFTQTLSVSAEINEPGYDYLKVIGQDAGGYFVLLSNLNLENPNDRVGLKNRKTKLVYFDTSLVMKWNIPVKTYPENAELEAIGLSSKPNPRRLASGSRRIRNASLISGPTLW